MSEWASEKQTKSNYALSERDKVFLVMKNFLVFWLMWRNRHSPNTTSETAHPSKEAENAAQSVNLMKNSSTMNWLWLAYMAASSRQKEPGRGLNKGKFVKCCAVIFPVGVLFKNY